MREQISHYPGSNLDLVMLRFLCKGDSQLMRFMEHLHARYMLDSTSYGDLFGHSD